MVVLIGFVENLRQGLPIAIPWMLDELLRLDEENTRGLLDALSQQQIFLMTTSPDIKPELDPCFTRRYVLKKVGENGERLMSPVLVEIDGEHHEDDPFDVLDEEAEPVENSEEVGESA